MTKPSILLVEDDADLRRGLAARLMASGYAVVQASDATTAVSTARSARPDLILLDVGLPGGDGFTVLERLRQMAILAVTPVVVLTAREPASVEREARHAGVFAVLEKPADNELLLSTIARALAGRAATTGHDRPKRKVLVIEDDADTRLGLSIRLRSLGYDVLQTGDGATATTIARRDRPDAILLDLGLPAGDGFVLLDRLKRNAALGAIPVIVLSARDPAANAPRAIQAGAFAFLQKPADNDLLARTLAEALGSVSA